MLQYIVFNRRSTCIFFPVNETIKEIKIIKPSVFKLKKEKKREKKKKKKKKKTRPGWDSNRGPSVLIWTGGKTLTHCATHALGELLRQTEELMTCTDTINIFHFSLS